MSRKKSQTISLSKALGILQRFEHECRRFTDESTAQITHWLAHQSRTPIGLTPSRADEWRAVLQKELGDPAAISYRSIPFPPVMNPGFTFIDLFAGIGGFRLALQRFGGSSVFSSEWDKRAKETYYANYGEMPFGDIRQFTAESNSDRLLKTLIPDHDILAAGFPCQPFSTAGVSARNALGKSHGFSCEIQGTLFFDIMRIAKVKRPRALFLENVRNLQSHDRGRTFATIRDTIENDLGYSFSFATIDASSLVPQRRKRCYIIALRSGDPFVFPEFSGEPLPLRHALETQPESSYTLSDKMWEGHQKRTIRNVTRGTGFTAFLADVNRPANTLVARYYKDGKECLIPQVNSNPRMLTERECARLQGYPEIFRPHPTRGQAYRQFGNSVAVPVVQKIAKSLVATLKLGASK